MAQVRKIMTNALFTFKPCAERDWDAAGNPLHTVLLVFIGIAILWSFRTSLADNGAWGLFLSVLLGDLTYCAVLSWQPWCNRLQLPLFILGSIFAGRFMARSLPRGLSFAVCLFLLILAIPYSCFNEDHPLLSNNYEPSILKSNRESQYFLEQRPGYTHAYTQMVNVLRAEHVKTVGLVGCYWQVEYPLWVLLHDRLGYWPQITHLDNTFPNKWQNPDAIVLFRKDVTPFYSSYFASRNGCKVVDLDNFVLLLPQGAFSGFGVLNGLKPAEGPFPSWNLPQVRWGTAPATKLFVRANEAGLWELEVGVRAGVGDQSIDVLVNGRRAAMWPLVTDSASRFMKIKCDLPFGTGNNIVELRYAQPQPDHAGENAVLFNSINFVEKPSPDLIREMSPRIKPRGTPLAQPISIVTQ